MTAGAENAAEKIEDGAGRAGAGGVRDAGIVDDGGARLGRVAGKAVEPIPSSIVQAICQIMVTVEAVKKSAFNEHGRYKFASTDDIYAALTRKMGEVGLICMALEDKCEIKRIEKPAKDKGALIRDKEGNLVMETVQWAHVEYSFVWATTDATWSDPKAKRTIFIQVTGPQTFQAAQSFIEKAYMRSTFKIPTGDMDLDSMPQAETEEDQGELSKTPKRKTSYRAKKDGDDAAYNELRGAISGADGPADLLQIRTKNWPFWSQLPDRWRTIVDEEYEDRMQEFGISQAAE